MDNLPLGADDGACDALPATRVITFAGLCAFVTAIQLFDNVIILENTAAFNNALYTILAQAAFLAAVGGIGMVRPLRFPRGVVISAGIVAAAGAPLSIATASMSAGTAAAIAGGLAMALLAVSWGNRLAAADPQHIAAQLSSAALVGSLLCFACFIAPVYVTEAALAVAALLACLPWAIPTQKAATADVSQRDGAQRFRLPVSALVTLGASCLVCAFFSGATMNPYALQSNTAAWIMHLVTIAAFAVAALTCAARKRFSLNGALLAMLVLLLGGLLMLSTGITGTVIVPVSIIGATRTLLWATSFAVLSAIASAHREHATGIFGLGLLVSNGALGRGIGIIASSTAHASFTDLALVGMAAIVAIALVYALMSATTRSEQSLDIGFDLGFAQTVTSAATAPANEPAAQPQTPDDALTERLAIIGLTQKETQVAVLMVDNRTNADIAEKLGISERTVKFHASNIYRKAEVSTKAEFRAKYRIP